MSKRDEREGFLRLHLGDDWERRLTAANATAGPDFSEAEVHAARQRAVDLVRSISPKWTGDMSHLVAEAWLSCQPVSRQQIRSVRRFDRRRSRRVAQWSAREPVTNRRPA